MDELSMIGLGAKLNNEINRTLSMTNPMMAVINAHRDMMDRVIPHRNLFAVNKIASTITNSFWGLTDPSGIGSIAHIVQKQFNLAIPNETASIMDMIAKQHQQMFGIANSITKMMKTSGALGQMSDLQQAIQSITGKITGMATLQQRWDLIDDFEQVSSQALELTGNIDSELGMTEENSKSFQELLDFVYAVLKKHKMVGIYSIIFVDMVLRIASFHQYYDFLKPKPESATKADLEKFETKIFKAIQEKLKSEKEYRKTNRVCKVYLKPKPKSMVIKKLAANTDVIVLQIKGIWVYVSFLDDEDNLSLTGWVMKKYLDKP